MADPLSESDRAHLRAAVRLAREHAFAADGGPFGALIVREGEVIGRGWNRVTSRMDPTAHAEIEAIRDACRVSGSFSLAGCVIYSSCEPCPMCLAAIQWARLSRLVYAATRADAARAGFDDAFLYEQLTLPAEERALPTGTGLRDEAAAVLREWSEWDERTPY